MADLEKEVEVRLNKIEKKASSFQREIALEISGLKSWFKKQLQAQKGSSSSSSSKTKTKPSPKRKVIKSESESSEEEEVEIESQPSLPRGAQKLSDFLKNKIPVVNLRRIPEDFQNYSLEVIEKDYSPIPVLTSTNDKYNFRRRFKSKGGDVIEINSDDNVDADDESDEPSSGGSSKKVPGSSSVPRKGILKVRTFNNELIVIDSEYDGLRKSTRIGTPNGQSASKNDEVKSHKSKNDDSSEDSGEDSALKTPKQNQKKTASKKDTSGSNKDSRSNGKKSYDSDEESTEESNSDNEKGKNASVKKESVRRKLRFADNETSSESKDKVSKKYNKSPVTVTFRAATKRPLTLNDEDSASGDETGTSDDSDSDAAWDPKNADDENPMKRARKKLKWGNL